MVVAQPREALVKEALIYSHTCIQQQGRLIKPCLEKLLVQLNLCQSQNAKTLLSHPFGAWLLLFPDFVADL